MCCKGKELKGKDKEGRAGGEKWSNRLTSTARGALGGDPPSWVGGDLGAHRSFLHEQKQHLVPALSLKMLRSSSLNV